MNKYYFMECIKILICACFVFLFVGIIEHYKQQAEVCKNQPTIFYVCDNIVDIYNNTCRKIEIFKHE